MRLTNFNGLLFFVASSSGTFPQLWRSNGTEAGTTLVKSGVDYRSGPPIPVGNRLFFTVNLDLWVTDGTPEGTELVKDPESSLLLHIFNLASANGRLFFTHISHAYGNEVWTAEVPQHQDILATGADAGGGPHVRVFDAASHEEINSFFAYDPGFTGGVRVAMADFDGDGTDDIVTAPGPGGGPHIRVFSGATGQPLDGPLGGFFAYDIGFRGGVYVAAGDINGDGQPDIITGADAGGGPHVRVFSGADGAELGNFFAYDIGFTGGVRLAVGDIDGNGTPEIITAPGPGGGPHVRVFANAGGEELAGWEGGFYAYTPDFLGGIYVASGDVDADTRDDIITGAGPGGGPHVRAISGLDRSELASFYAYNADFSGGVRVAAIDLDANFRADIVTSAGPGGGPHVRVFDRNGGELASLFAYNLGFRGGVFISGGVTTDASPLPATSQFEAGALDSNLSPPLHLLNIAAASGSPHSIGSRLDSSTSSATGESVLLPIEDQRRIDDLLRVPSTGELSGVSSAHDLWDAILAAMADSHDWLIIDWPGEPGGTTMGRLRPAIR